jgi:predicted ATPase
VARGTLTRVGGVLCPVLCGRDDEMHALRTAFAQASAGRGGLVFITGEPGIGKSRLVRELAGHARSAGAGAVTGRAVPGGSSIPFRPLTEALLQALRDCPVPSDGDLQAWLPALQAILPGIVPSGSAGRPEDAVASPVARAEG